MLNQVVPVHNSYWHTQTTHTLKSLLENVYHYQTCSRYSTFELRASNPGDLSALLTEVWKLTNYNITNVPIRQVRSTKIQTCQGGTKEDVPISKFSGANFRGVPILTFHCTWATYKLTIVEHTQSLQIPKNWTYNQVFTETFPAVSEQRHKHCKNHTSIKLWPFLPLSFVKWIISYAIWILNRSQSKSAKWVRPHQFERTLYQIGNWSSFPFAFLRLRLRCVRSATPANVNASVHSKDPKYI